MAGQVPFPRPGGVVGGKYVLESMLDSDASGAVFRARHSNTGRPFAIRWLVRGTRSSASIRPASQETLPVDDCYQNPLVLSPLDVGRTPHGTYIVMEWLHGETLSSRLQCEGALPLSAAAELLVPCMRAVHELHLARVVHRDLRPGNIFICRGVEHHPESARVFDYSLAGAHFAPARVDEHGEYTRDAHFLAPEQIANAPVDHRADVYAFGVLLYHCITGQLPFLDRSDDFARWIYSQDPPSLPGAPGLTPLLYRFLTHAMARDVSDRFNSCDELAGALEDVARQSSQVIVSIAPMRVIRSTRPTMRLEGDLSMPPPAPAKRPSLRPTMTGAAGLSMPPPAANTPRSMRPTLSRMPVLSVPPTAAQQLHAGSHSLRATVTNVPTVSVPHMAGPPPTAASQVHAAPSSRMPAGSVPPPAAGVSGNATSRAVDPTLERAATVRVQHIDVGHTVPPPRSWRPIPQQVADSSWPHPQQVADSSWPLPAASAPSMRPTPQQRARRASLPPSAAQPPERQLRSSPLPPAPVPGSFRAPPRPGATHLRLSAADNAGSSVSEHAVTRPTPLHWSPGNTGRPANDNGSASSSAYSKPPVSINESTLPLEVLRPRSYRKPIDRGLILGGVGFVLLGIVPTVAYFAPPVEDHDVLSSKGLPSTVDQRLQPSVQAAAQLPAPAALPIADPSITSANDIGRTQLAAPEPSNAAVLADDPNTPIDESDPIIAAALEAQDHDTPIVDEAQAASAPADNAEPKQPAAAVHTVVKSSPRALKVSATPAPGARAPKETPMPRVSAPSHLRPDSAYKPQPATSKLPWEVPAARKSDSR